MIPKEAIMKYVLLVFLIVTWLLGWAVAVEYLIDKYGAVAPSHEKVAETHAATTRLPSSSFM
jgi:hypothetical protein